MKNVTEKKVGTTYFKSMRKLDVVISKSKAADNDFKSQSYPFTLGTSLVNLYAAGKPSLQLFRLSDSMLSLGRLSLGFRLNGFRLNGFRHVFENMQAFISTINLLTPQQDLEKFNRFLLCQIMTHIGCQPRPVLDDSQNQMQAYSQDWCSTYLQKIVQM
jgi:hypothetical protein